MNQDDLIKYFQNPAGISFNLFSHSMDKIAKVLIKRFLFYDSDIGEDFTVVQAKNSLFPRSAISVRFSVFFNHGFGGGIPVRS